MSTDVTRDELEAALAATGIIVEEPRLLRALYPAATACSSPPSATRAR